VVITDNRGGLWHDRGRVVRNSLGIRRFRLRAAARAVNSSRLFCEIRGWCVVAATVKYIHDERFRASGAATGGDRSKAVTGLFLAGGSTVVFLTHCQEEKSR